MKRLWLMVAAMLVLVTPLAAANSVRGELASESTLEKVLKRGVLRVGMSTFVPWAMKDKQGELAGFEIDVARRLAGDMGVKVEFVPTKWSGIIPALLTGKFDVIIGGMGILPERNLKVNFSLPYDHTGMAIMANRSKAHDYKDLSDFNREDVVIVARIGTTASQAVNRHMPRAKLKLFDDESQAVLELLNGRAHAMVASAPLPAFQVIEHPDRLYLPVEGTFTREPIGFAIRKSDMDTLNYLNNWILVVGSEGWLAERKHYWFETREWESRIR